ncbi:MAG: hypothetical protein OEY22_02860 [Candidatus Bathyarchaeota archaeon]|nr:hypothetical protein [Candidatus Bathyarchaeota archaeon]MDH5788026.1 hypothetical protein [Candidatus Bathyarchaeota archaeon]
MSFRDYLHEKAEESRHNETRAYLIFLAGAIFFVGGIIETLSLTSSPEWLLFIPYFAESHAGAVLGLVLVISGVSLMVFGIASGIRRSRDRSWYMQELGKANSVEETLMVNKVTKNTRKRKSKQAKEA